MAGPEKDEDDEAALRARLEKLSAAFDKRDAEERDRASGKSPPEGSFGRAMGTGFTVLSEFIAAVVVGVFIGWRLDAWFGTAPLLLIVFLALGTAAGFWNVYRVAAPKEPPSDAPRE